MSDQTPKGGCAMVLVVAIVVLALLSLLPSNTKRSMSGSIGYIDTKTTTGQTPKLEGYRLAKEVYDFASENPSLDKIVIRMKFVLGNMYVDKYGNEAKGERDMGSFQISDLDEVRRYRDASAYAHQQQGIYAILISQLKYSDLMYF